MTKNKKIKIESLIVLIITIILIWYILKDNFVTTIKLLKYTNFLYLLLAIVTYLIYFFIEAMILKIIINKYDKNYSVKNALELSIMTKFFNGVTPFSLGGQPLQIYELNKEKVSISDSALIIVENFIVFQITIVSLGILAYIASFFFTIDPSPILWNLTIIGFIINILILLFVLFICIKIDYAKKIGYWFIKIFNKMHIIKKINNANNKWNKICTDYYNGFKQIANNKKIMFKCVLLDIICMIINFMIPLFVFKAINVNININVLLCIILSTYTYIVGSYVPIPGGSGGIEYSFINYFKLIIKEVYITPTVILWRFIYYYFPVLIGAIIFNIKNKPFNNQNN